MKFVVYEQIKNAKGATQSIGVSELIAETAASVRIEISSGRFAWFPKSQITIFQKEAGGFVVEIPTWLYQAKLNEIKSR